MSDLISRSELIEAIKHHKENVCVCEDGKTGMELYRLAHEHIIELVEILSTAYNTDKVVDQLEEEIKENPNVCETEYRAGLYKAIEIVKGGGISE